MEAVTFSERAVAIAASTMRWAALNESEFMAITSDIWCSSRT
jgi:hypothetical protein